MLEQNGLAILQRNYGIPAALNLSFMNDSELSSRITFTRASGATRFNKKGLLEVVGNDVPRFDYDPSAILNQNIVQNSTFTGAVVGGTCPGLSVASSTGITVAIVGTGTFADGTPYMDVRYSGTASGTGFPTLSSTALFYGYQGLQTIAQATIQLIAGTVPGAPFILQAMCFTEALGFVGSASIGLNSTLDGTPKVFTTAVLTVGVNATRVSSNIQCNVTIGNVVDFTIRVSKWQCNTGNTVLPYVPTSGTAIFQCAPKGLLIEESRTNGCPYSDNLALANWFNSGGVTAAAGGSSPTGGAATALTYTAAGTRYIGSVINSSLVPHTTSGYIKYFSGQVNSSLVVAGQSAFGGVGGDRLVTINSSTGAFVSSTAEVGSNYTITPVGNGWFRVTGTFTPTTAGVPYNIGWQSGNAAVLYAYGVQTEVGAFATSYIPTTAAAATRAADSAIISGANFSSWYNQTQGTFVASAIWSSPPGPASPQLLLQTDNATSAERIYLRRSTGGITNIDSAVGSVFQGLINPTPNTLTTGVVHKLGIAYSAAATGTALNAGTVGVSGAKLVPTVSQMTLGSALNGVYLNGHIRSIQYYNTKLTDAQLQALTS